MAITTAERLLYRRRDAADVLGVSVSTLAKYERDGLIRAVRVPDSRIVRYPVAEVRALAARILAGDLSRPVTPAEN